MCQKPLEERYRDTCIRLYEWGKWSIEFDSHGYPTMSTEQMAKEGGGIDTRGSGLKQIEQSPEVAEIDNILLMLKTIDVVQFTIIRHYFAGYHASLSFVWNKMGGKKSELSRSKIREELIAAVAWIDGKLSSI